MYVVSVRVWVMVRAKVRNRVMVTARVRRERECKCDTNSLTHPPTNPASHSRTPAISVSGCGRGYVNGFRIYENIRGLHTASLLGVPASFTVVSVQGLCAVHFVLSSSLALNVPLEQSSHFAEFPSLAATNFLPAAHFVIMAVTKTMHGAIVCVCV